MTGNRSNRTGYRRFGDHGHVSHRPRRVSCRVCRADLAHLEHGRRCPWALGKQARSRSSPRRRARPAARRRFVVPSCNRLTRARARDATGLAAGCSRPDWRGSKVGRTETGQCNGLAGTRGARIIAPDRAMCGGVALRPPIRPPGVRGQGRRAPPPVNVHSPQGDDARMGSGGRRAASSLVACGSGTGRTSRTRARTPFDWQ